MDHPVSYERLRAHADEGWNLANKRTREWKDAEAQLAALKVALDEAAGFVNMMDGQVVLDLMMKYPQGSPESQACSALVAHIINARDALTRYAALNGPALEPRAARGQKGKR